MPWQDLLFKLPCFLKAQISNEQIHFSFRATSLTFFPDEINKMWDFFLKRNLVQLTFKTFINIWLISSENFIKLIRLIYKNNVQNVLKLNYVLKKQLYRIPTTQLGSISLQNNKNTSKNIRLYWRWKPACCRLGSVSTSIGDPFNHE